MIRKKALIAFTAILTALSLCLPTFAAAMEWKNAEIPYNDYFGGYIGSVASTGENDESGFQITSRAEAFDGEIADPANYISDSDLRQKVAAGSWQTVTQGMTPFSTGSMIYNGAGGVDVGARSGQVDLPGAAMDAHIIVREEDRSNATITDGPYKRRYPGAGKEYNYGYIYDFQINNELYDITVNTLSPGTNESSNSSKIEFEANIPVMLITSIKFYVNFFTKTTKYGSDIYLHYTPSLSDFLQNGSSYIKTYNASDGINYVEKSNQFLGSWGNNGTTSTYGYVNLNYNYINTFGLAEINMSFTNPIELTSGTTLKFWLEFSSISSDFTKFYNRMPNYKFYKNNDYINPYLETSQGQIVQPFTWFPYTDGNGVRYTDYTFRIGVTGTQNESWQLLATVNVQCNAASGTELKLSDFSLNYVVSDVYWQYDSELEPPETDPGGGDDPGGPSGPGFTDDTRRVEGMDDVIGGYDDIYKPDIDISGQDIPGYSGSDLSGAVGLAAALGKYSKSVFVIPKIGIGLGISIAAIFIKHILKTSAD